MPCGRCHAQTRDDHHHCSPQADFTNDIPADLLQKTGASLSCPRARLNCQPISSAEADQDAEQRELKNEKNNAKEPESQNSRTPWRVVSSQPGNRQRQAPCNNTKAKLPDMTKYSFK